MKIEGKALTSKDIDREVYYLPYGIESIKHKSVQKGVILDILEKQAGVLVEMNKRKHLLPTTQLRWSDEKSETKNE